MVAVVGISTSSRAGRVGPTRSPRHQSAASPTRSRCLRRQHAAPQRCAGDDPPHRAGESNQRPNAHRVDDGAAERQNLHADLRWHRGRRDQTPVVSAPSAPRSGRVGSSTMRPRYPTVVLGAEAADRLPSTASTVSRSSISASTGSKSSASSIPCRSRPTSTDRSSSVTTSPRQLFGIDETASTVRIRTEPDSVGAVQAVLAATTNPQKPNNVSMTAPIGRTRRESIGRQGTHRVAVGPGLGRARRRWCGHRERDGHLGARTAQRDRSTTPRSVPPRATSRGQFLVESVLLSCFGGLSGVALGAAVTGGYAHARRDGSSIPVTTLAAGVGASLVLGGAIVGLYPAAPAATRSGGGDQADRPLRSATHLVSPTAGGEEPAHERHVVVEGCADVVGVERHLVVLGAEFGRVIGVRRVAVARRDCDRARCDARSSSPGRCRDARPSSDSRRTRTVSRSQHRSAGGCTAPACRRCRAATHRSRTPRRYRRARHGEAVCNECSSRLTGKPPSSLSR